MIVRAILRVTFMNKYHLSFFFFFTESNHFSLVTTKQYNWYLTKN